MGSMAKVLVLGSSGFGGASYVKCALEHGHHVVGCSRSLEPSIAYLPYRWRDYGGRFEFHQIDLNHDLKKLNQLLQRERPHYLVNFAAQSMVAQSWDTPTDWMQTNVVSNTALMELLRHYHDLKLYIHFSTPEVYGNTADWITESTHYNPSSPYALSRAAGDMTVQLWHKTYGIPTVITRAANIYGEGQQVYRIITKTALCILNGEKLPLHGGGLSERAFIHMDDVSTALEAILRAPTPGEHYHISTADAISIRNLVEQIAQQLGRALEDVTIMAEDRLGKDQAYLLDSTKIRTQLGWRDTVSLDEGLARCIRWVNAHLDELRTLPAQYIHKP
jgi:dTDP-glucose 4,6-dehydratase